MTSILLDCTSVTNVGWTEENEKSEETEETINIIYLRENEVTRCYTLEMWAHLEE